MAKPDYSRLLRRIGRGPLSAFLLSSCIVAAVLLLVSSRGLSSRTYTVRQTDRALSLLDSLKTQIQLEERRIADIKRLQYHREGMIAPGQGMFQALGDLGISHRQSLALVNALSDTVELINMVAGERLWAELDPNDTTKVLSVSYSPNPSVVHTLTANDSGFFYSREDRPTTVRHRLVEGTLEQGSSLDQLLREKGIYPSMVGVVNGVLLCKISFRTHAREGDQFKVLLREEYYQDSIRIDGQVLYTAYNGVMTGFHEAFRYDDGDPKSSYTAHYTESGEALIHSGLRYPLDRLHIRSGYGMRRHPLTGRRTMHRGVDYRASVGTPVYSVASGTVVKSGYNGVNGNYIAIRHADRYTSYYLHLHSRLASKGQAVRARQIIGKAGSTGRSTGPHLHFGFRKPNGAWMDPLRKRMIATPKLQGERLARLEEQVREIRALLDSLQPPTQVAAAHEVGREAD
ncbi:MAG: peptidoglycan DD-metalloendopeptidase family protein [Chitinivibrionales bacterium]|nr:peptidoglycan DD-metalloendopeptidase family protein [Chitinivibrionales bacterium]